LRWAVTPRRSTRRSCKADDQVKIKSLAMRRSVSTLLACWPVSILEIAEWLVSTRSVSCF